MTKRNGLKFILAFDREYEPDFYLQVRGLLMMLQERISNKSKVELFHRSPVAGYRRLLYSVQGFRKGDLFLIASATHIYLLFKPKDYIHK